MAFPVSFFQIQGEDPTKLIKFYQKAFDWQGAPAPDGGLMVAPEAGGIPGAVGPSRDGSPHLAIYVTVENVTKHLARAKRAGARVVMPETELPANMGSIGGILDPAGNWLGLWAAGAAGAPEPPKPTNGQSLDEPAQGEPSLEEAVMTDSDASMSEAAPATKPKRARKQSPAAAPAAAKPAKQAPPPKKKAVAKKAAAKSAKAAPSAKVAPKAAKKAAPKAAKKAAPKAAKKAAAKKAVPKPAKKAAPKPAKKAAAQAAPKSGKKLKKK